MIEIKDTRKTATKNPRPKVGQIVRVNKMYLICCKLDSGDVNLFNITDGLASFSDRCADNDCFLFTNAEISAYDIEVITSKITLTIE